MNLQLRRLRRSALFGANVPAGLPAYSHASSRNGGLVALRTLATSSQSGGPGSAAGIAESRRQRRVRWWAKQTERVSEGHRLREGRQQRQLGPGNRESGYLGHSSSAQHKRRNCQKKHGQGKKNATNSYVHSDVGPEQHPHMSNRNSPLLTRLNVVMRDRGICSRLEADDFIAQGWVRVNGDLAKLGDRVDLHDQIALSPQAQTIQAGRLTVALHKPMSFISHTTSPKPRQRLAVDLLIRSNQSPSCGYKGLDPARLSKLGCCGRLDADSTGLVLYSQDGTVARRVLGTRQKPSSIPKHYLVDVELADQSGHRPSKAHTEETVAKLRYGLELDGEKLRAAEVEYRWINEQVPANKMKARKMLQLGMVLQQGKYRQIRRMCSLVGLRVVRLRRIAIGRTSEYAGLDLETLGLQRPGTWRVIRNAELDAVLPP